MVFALCASSSPSRAWSVSHSGIMAALLIRESWLDGGMGGGEERSGMSFS